MNQDRVLATYLIETPHSLEHAAAVIAGEQSSGTFVSVPGETSELKERFGAQVLRIEQLDTVPAPSLPGSKAPHSDSGRSVYRRGRVVLSFPLHNFGPSLPTLLSLSQAICTSCRNCPEFAWRISSCRKHSRSAILDRDLASRAHASLLRCRAGR